MARAVNLAGPSARSAGARSSRRPGLLRARYRTIALLVLLPFAVFGLPAAVGYPLIVGDDLAQNFPLRVLVGRILASGHAPLWDPYLWSGAPLLAGFNAGAAFPTTLLFGVLPATFAWVLTEALTYASAAAGLYVFLRLRRLVAPAALLGALTFAYGGFMAGQLVHIGAVSGVAMIPWLLVSLVLLENATRRAPLADGWPTAARAALPGAALFALAVGLLILAASPGSMLYGMIAVGVYVLFLLRRHRRRGGRRALVGWVVAAGVVGLLVGAIQWLPGLLYAESSQRGAVGFSFFSSGSLPLPLTLLLLIPNLVGGYGRFGQPSYAGTFNLPELTSYVGILPLVAAFATIPRNWGRGRRLAERRAWQAIALLGLVLSWGGNTPLGQVLYHIPIYGQQRDQSRNVATLDLALAILLALWVDGLLRGATARARSRPSGMLAFLPPLLVVVLAVAVLVWEGPAQHLLTVGSVIPGLFVHLAATLAISALLAVVAAVIVVRIDHWGVGRRTRVLTMFVVADLLVFAATGYWAPPHRVTLQRVTPTSAPLAAAMGSGGRFAVFDPGLLLSSAVPQMYRYPQLNILGQPDLNILRRLPSVQGYGSVVSGGYNGATGAHAQTFVRPVSLANGVMSALNLRILLSFPIYFSQRVPSGAPLGAKARYVHATRLSAGGRAVWYFGDQQTVSRVAVPVLAPASSAAGLAHARVGLVGMHGTIRWPSVRTVVVGGTLRVQFLSPEPAAGFLVSAPPHVAVLFGVPRAVTQTGPLVLDGTLQGFLPLSQWRPDGMIGSFALFKNTQALGPYWLQGLPAHIGSHAPSALPAVSTPSAQLAGGAIHVLHSSVSGSATVQVRTPSRAVLVRSEADASGWRAWVRGPGNSSGHWQPVIRVGLVQGVVLPAGTWTVRYSYRPGIVVAAGGATLLGFAVVLSAGLLGVRVRRGRRDHESPATPQSSPPASSSVHGSPSNGHGRR